MIEFREKEITFGGYPVETLTDDNGNAIIQCKGVTGTLDQLEHWLYNHVKDPYTKYYFGYGKQRSEIVRDGEMVKIACLEEEYVEFKLKLNRFIYDISRGR